MTKRLRVSLQLVVTSAVRGVDVPAPRSPSRPRPPLPPKPCSLFPGRGDLGFASLTIKSSTSQFSALSRWSYKRLCLITWCSSSPSCNEVNQRLSMFDDLPRKYHRALPLLEYHSADTLRAAFEQKVINPALEKAAGGAASDSSGPPSDGRRMIKSASIPVLNRSACI